MSGETCTMRDSSEGRGETRLTLLVGGGGVIGGVLLKGLTGRKVVLDTKGPPPGGVPGRESAWVVGSAVDPEALRVAFAGVTHAVYLPTGGPTWEGLMTADVQGFKAVCDAAVAQGVQRVVYTSSNHAVGGVERDHFERGERQPQYDPAAPVRPDSLYGVAKAAGEALCRYYAEEGVLKTSCIRIGTVRAVDDIALCAAEPGFSYIPGGLPAIEARLRKTWLSHGALVRIVEEELASADDFRLRFGISPANADPYWSTRVLRWNSAEGRPG